MPGECHVIETVAFAVEPEEDAGTNPGRHGRAFANFVAEQFRARGEAVEAVAPEDFGWCVLLGRKPAKRFICCGNRDGRTDAWMAFAVVETGLVGRLFGSVNVEAEANRLSRLLADVLQAAPGVTAYSTED
jgi:hypothetical protein